LAEERNLIAAAVVEIFVRQHTGLGVFKFTKLPMKDDRLCLPSSHRRGRLNRYVVTDVEQDADPERKSANPAEPLHPCIYVSFCDEILLPEALAGRLSPIDALAVNLA
jgi:hypothetical protein